jgi:hypothetical protein
MVKKKELDGYTVMRVVEITMQVFIWTHYSYSKGGVIAGDMLERMLPRDPNHVHCVPASLAVVVRRSSLMAGHSVRRVRSGYSDRDSLSSLCRRDWETAHRARRRVRGSCKTAVRCC